MIEIEITNYESLEHIKLEVEGFTTIIGRNYLGKSAILRAINAALTNKEGTDFIRWGQKFCEVHLKFPDLDIIWHKEDGNNFYNINGKVYSKIGRGEPPKEIQDAGFKPIVIGDQKINLNYAVQFFPLFLVNKRDSKTADLLTSVYGLDKIYTAIDLCNKEQRANSDLLRIREKDLKIIDQDLLKYNSFPSIWDMLPDLKSRKEEITNEELEIKKLQVLYSETLTVSHIIRKLKPVNDIVLPTSGIISESIKEYEELLRYQEAVQSNSRDIKRLKPVSEVTLPNRDNIESEISEYNKLVRYQREYETNSSIVERLQPIISVSIQDNKYQEIKTLIADIERLTNWYNSVKTLSSEIKNLEKVKDIILPSCTVDFSEVQKIQGISDNLRSLASEVQTLKNNMDKIDSELVQVNEEIQAIDVCPLCGAKRCE